MHSLLHTFSLTPKITFECLAGQENGLIHTLIKRTFLIIRPASDLSDSLNTASFVNYVCVLECAPGYI